MRSRHHRLIQYMHIAPVFPELEQEWSTHLTQGWSRNRVTSANTESETEPFKIIRSVADAEAGSLEQELEPKP